MADVYNYHVSIPWHILRAHFEKLRREVSSEMEGAEGNEVYKLQGDARRLRKLMNLDETLSFLQEEDARVEEEKKPKGGK